jgi:sortase (surface protein transpeptidase)
VAVPHPVTTQVVRDKRSYRQLTWWLIAATALIVSAVSLVGLLPTSAPSGPNVVVLAKTPAKLAAPRVTTVPALSRSRPVQLTIPAIQVATSVGTLGLRTDHQVMVPTSTTTVGWYVNGAAPGQIGSAVILGHVDSYTGPGVFFELKTLVAGDRINVVLADGAVTTFAVTKVVEYSKTSFPDQLVYGSHGIRSLQLVTCGGTFDHATGHYESNVVVYSQLVSTSSVKS